MSACAGPAIPTATDTALQIRLRHIIHPAAVPTQKVRGVIGITYSTDR